MAYFRGIAAAAVKNVESLGPGAMLALGLSKEETQALILELKQGNVNIACINSPTSVTVSGDLAAIEELLDVVQAQGSFARRLAVDTAYHSHHMEPVADSYLKALGNIHVSTCVDVEFYSSVSGKRIEPPELGPEYWVANLVSPVRFSDSMKSLCLGTGSKRRKRRGANSAVDVILEVGPHSALSGPIKQNLQSESMLSNASLDYLSVLVRNKNAIDTTLEVAGSLFKRGLAVDLHAINFPFGYGSSNVLADLPPYPWNHMKSYWAISMEVAMRNKVDFPRSDFLGIPAKNFNPSEPQWRNVMRTSEIPWILDHNIQSNTVCPAACFLAMAIEASYQRATARGINITGYRLREVSIGHALIISQSDEVETKLSLRPYNESVRNPSDMWDEFTISSSRDGWTWTEHCQGLISVQKQREVTEVDGGREAREEKGEQILMMLDYERACKSEIDSTEVYAALKELGLNFGPTFSNMVEVRSGTDKCVAKVAVADTAAIMPAKFEYPFILHPATLDSFIHAIFPVGNGHKVTEQGTPVPTFVEEMFVSHDIPKEPGFRFTVYAKSEKKDLGNSASKGIAGTINRLSAFDPQQPDFKPAVMVKGLVFSSLPRSSDGEPWRKVERISHQTKWAPTPEFLSPTQLVEFTAPLRQPSTLPVANICQAAFFYAERALKLVSASEVPQHKSHLHKLYDVIRDNCDAVFNGRLGMFDTSSWLQADAAERAALCSKLEGTPYELLCHLGKHLHQILRGEVDPLSVMMEGNRLEKHYKENQFLSQCYEQAAAYVSLLANKNPFLNVLEIGAGTGSTTFPILEQLIGPDGPRFENYDFTDISPGFFEKVMDKTQNLGDLVKFMVLDIEKDAAEQGFEIGSYDLIIAANVLHATRSIADTLKNVRTLLKPGGILILIEITVNNLPATLMFGTLPGWWLGEQDDY